MADRLQNGFGFGQGFSANGLDGQPIGGIPNNVEQTPQWAQFGQSHATNPNMNPQMAQLLIQRNSQAGAQMQANNFQQHGLFEQQFGGAGGLLGNGQMNAIQAQQFNNAARAQQQPHQQQPFLPPNQELVRQMGLLQSQNNPLHQQQQATLNLLGQRLGQHNQQPHLSPQQQQQQPQQPQQQQQVVRGNILLTLVTNMGAPTQPRATANLVNGMPTMRPEELVGLARQARAIEADINTRIGETQNMARGGANSIQVATQLQDLQKKLNFIMNFAHKINQEVMVRKDKGQFPVHLLQQIPAPSGVPLPRTLPNGMTNPDWLKAHGAPPDLFTNGAYPQHEVQAAVDRMRQSIINQGAGPQATQNQLAQLQALQNQHAAQRAPSRQNGPPNPATPGLPHASPMPQPANVNPQQAPSQQPGGPGPQPGAGPMTAADMTARLSRLPPCEENMFVRMWPMWVKQTGQMLTMEDIPPPETLQGKPSISLYRLHAAVWQFGGHDTVGERWPMLAGRLGWGTMNDPTQGALAPPMAAERLRQHHVTHLKEFDKFYYNLQRQKLLQHMQNQQGQPRLGPEKLQQAMQAAALGASSEELRARGIGDDVIAFVEQHRDALVQKHREQTAFKQGLQGQQQQGQQQQMHPGQQQQQQIQAQMNGVGVGGMGGAGAGNNGMHQQQPVPGQLPGQGPGLPQGQQPPQVGHLSPAQLQALAQRTMQLFGPLPSARELKGVRPDGSIDPTMYRVAVESVTKMKRSIEPQLTSRFQPVDPPVDVDRNEWMALLERGFLLAADIEKTLPTFIAYTQGPHLANILSKYVGQIMTVQFQKKLLGQHPARFIVDLNALRGFIQQFSNLLVILRNRITGVRLELQQLHGPAGPRPPSQQGGPPGPPGPPHMGQMGQQLGVPGQQHGVGLPNQPPVPGQGLGRVPTPQGMGRVPTPQQMMQARVPTPAQFPPTPHLNSAEAMPPPLVPPNVAVQQHKRKVSENMQSPAAAAAGSPHTPAPAAAASPQTPQTPKQKPKPKPKPQRRKSMVQPTPAVEDKDKDVGAGESSNAAASGSTSNLKGNKRPREEEPATAAAATSPKRAKADWEGPPSDVQERRVKAAEEAPRDDAAAADFVDDMMRQFASFEGDAAPLAREINAILATVMPGGAGGGVGGEGGNGKDEGGLESGGLGAEDIFDFSQYLDFDAGLGSGAGNGGAGTVGATPELVHGSSANPSPESGSEPEAAAGGGGGPASSANGSEKTPAGLSELGFGALDDPLHTGVWSEIDGGETSYYHGNAGWRWDGPMAASEQPWAISTS